VKRLECLGITLVAAVAVINPGTGYLSGFFAAVVISSLIWARNARTWTSGTIDVLAAIAIGLVLLSPYWHVETTAQTSPSHGAAVSIIFFIAVRIVVTHAAVFRELATQLAVLCTVYAAYFMVSASSYDELNDRAAVSFSNANYTGAVLAFGGSAALFLAADGRAANRGRRILWVAAFALQALAIYASGSRASFGGLALAAVAIVTWRWASRATTAVVGWIAAGGFVFALIPNSISLFTKPAYLLAGAGTFARGDSASNASGRAEIWQQANDVLDEAWLQGWGPGNYYLTVGDDPTFLAHAWGLEYLLSVGVLGTVFVAGTLLLSYRASARGSGAMWTAATALSLLPSLMLSTHQWTLWAWLGFALWSRAYLLGATRAPLPDE
jgi:O-antigen ligase